MSLSCRAWSDSASSSTCSRRRGRLCRFLGFGCGCCCSSSELACESEMTMQGVAVEVARRVVDRRAAAGVG